MLLRPVHSPLCPSFLLWTAHLSLLGRCWGTAPLSLLEASGRGAVTGVHGVCSLQAHGGCADRLSILSPLPLRPRVCVCGRWLGCQPRPWDRMGGLSPRRNQGSVQRQGCWQPAQPQTLWADGNIPSWLGCWFPGITSLSTYNVWFAVICFLKAVGPEQHPVSTPASVLRSLTPEPRSSPRAPRAQR